MSSPDIEYGVQWSGPDRHLAVMPCPDAKTAHWKARRVRALQRVFGNVADAAAVYRQDGGEWQLLLPAIAEELIAEFQELLNSLATAEEPPIP